MWRPKSNLLHLYQHVISYTCIIKLTAFSKKWLLLSMSIPSLTDEPHHPKSFAFPKRSFGMTKPVFCSAKSQWFDTWPFLHYDEGQDVMFCHTCVTAFKLGRIKSSINAATAFVSLYASKQYGHA